jgi:hypothetical protein
MKAYPVYWKEVEKKKRTNEKESLPVSRQPRKLPTKKYPI